MEDHTQDISEMHGITRMVRYAPPSHYLFKIESFSLLVDKDVKKNKSSIFQAGGHEWRLILYPNGNEKSKGSGYISLYLAYEQTENLSHEVNVDFKLFVFDQIRDQYLTIRDLKVPVRRFYEMKTEWGFSQLISQETFKDVDNGYLVNDSCIFGAEIFVVERPPTLVTSKIKTPIDSTITWNIEDFSKLDPKCYNSAVKMVDNIKWYLLLYPKGNSSDTHLSLFLKLAEPDKLPPKREIYAKYKLRLMDQIKCNHLERIGETWFSSSNTNRGFLRFVSLKDLYDSSNGYMVKDGLILEAEFIVIY